MAGLSLERILPAYDGLDTDSAPEFIAATKAPVLENFLVDRPGMLPIRGPINESTQIYSGAVAEKPVGIWVHNNNLLIGLKANSASATRDPWVAPYRRAGAEADLGVGHTGAFHLNLETGVTTSVTVTAATCPGPRHTRLGDNTWGISYSRAAAASRTVNGGRQWDTQLLRWDGTAVAPTGFVNGPLMSQDIRAHLNRLFVGGGLKPGTATYSPNSLFWTDLGGPTADTLAMWQDDVSGLTNEIVVDSNDPADFIVALAKVGSNLCVLKRRSMHMVYGRTIASLDVRPFSFELGCIDPRSVVEYRDGVFFMSDQGFVFFDGSQIINTSEDLRSTLLAESLKAVGDSGVDGGRVVAGRLPNDYIGVTVGTTPATTASSIMSFCALFHAPRAAWVSLTSDALSPTRPIALGRSLTRTFVVDDQRVIQANKLTAPETEVESSRGYDVTTPIFTFDSTSSGPVFNGAGDTLKNQETLVQAWTTQINVVIPARWHSRLHGLAQPMLRAQLHRLLVDYTFQVDGATDGQHSGWYVQLVDGQGNVLLPEFQVAGQGDPSSFAYRRQQSTDVVNEASDVQLRVEWRGTNILALQDASIFTSVVEYQPTRLRPSG